MTRIVEYNTATGHVETLAEVDDDKAAEFIAAADDHSTDHVVYPVHVDERQSNASRY